ncbi:MAG TPA: hypothetical protein VM677_16810 [Actinokineospora sp.]|nr:hypothetical protein [Actinokineospora sp.]
MTAPIEVRVAGGLIAATSAVFVGLGLARADLRAPLIFAAVGAAAVGLLFTRLRPARPVAAGLATLLTLGFAVLALGGGPWWVRVVAGVLAAADAYAVILLLTGPSRAHFGGARHE